MIRTWKKINTNLPSAKTKHDSVYKPLWNWYTVVKENNSISMVEVVIKSIYILEVTLSIQIGKFENGI